jgi:hypothetical protein
MSLEVIATIICDNCGERASSESCDRFTECGWFAGSHKRDLTEKKGWFTLNRGRFYPEAHYCPKCKDGAVKPLKGNPRWKGPEATEQISNSLQPACLLPDDHSVWILVENEKRLRIGSPCKIYMGDTISIRYGVRHSEKTFRPEQIVGWIENKELIAMLGSQPAL